VTFHPSQGYDQSFAKCEFTFELKKMKIKLILASFAALAAGAIFCQARKEESRRDRETWAKPKMAVIDFAARRRQKFMNTFKHHVVG